MVAKEYSHPKRTWLVVSLLIHGFFVAGLLTSLVNKKLGQPSFLKPTAQPQVARVTAQQQPPEKAEQEAEKQTPSLAKKPPLAADAKPFTVPAPVVFYGNQPFMNLPTPVSGSSEGKSTFDSKPTNLPTPPAHTISNERISATPQVPVDGTEKEDTVPQATTEAPLFKIQKEDAPTAPQQNKSLLEKDLFSEKPTFIAPPQTAQKKEKTIAPSTANDLIKRTAHTPTTAKKTLTLADLFKNAPTALAALGQAGEPSARKAGTEGGDEHGSGNQITIKEGDMKYYTLWAKFLNHLNQAARFNRRGKERRIQELVQTGQVTYVLQCAITVDKDGQLLDIDLMNSSGSKEFDALCVTDIKSAIPYPPLPDTLGKKTARFEVNVYP